jgi:hypothetical protein
MRRNDPFKSYNLFNFFVVTFAPIYTRKSASDSRGALPQSGTAEIIPVEPVRVMPAKGEVKLHVTDILAFLENLSWS